MSPSPESLDLDDVVLKACQEEEELLTRPAYQAHQLHPLPMVLALFWNDELHLLLHSLILVSSLQVEGLVNLV